MSLARYAPLPNPHSVPGSDAEREMNEAFQLDNDEDDEDDASESTPLTKLHDSTAFSHSSRPQLSVASPGAYDFEREYDYDYPPPGSPPDPSVARPNTIGNTNGTLPTSPVRPVPSRPSVFRRLAGVLLPQHYQRVPEEPHRFVGGGIENDGVFANVMAKPGRAVQVRDENGGVYTVPEETQSQAPPSYVEAQADAVPPYWEATIHAPSSFDPNADMIVDDLPTGSWYLFAATIFISYFFQFVGFLFTYLLHTTHAAKYGSRVGLGMTLIHFGFYSRRQSMEDADGVVPAPSTSWNETLIFPGTTPVNSTTIEMSMETYDVSSRDWVAFLLMTLGWFLLLSSLVGFYRVKRWERSIRSASPPAVNRDTEARRPVEHGHVFPLFMGFAPEDENIERRAGISEADAQLDRRLRESGLL